MEDLLVSLACQLIVSKTDLKIVVQKTLKQTECHYTLCGRERTPLVPTMPTIPWWILSGTRNSSTTDYTPTSIPVSVIKSAVFAPLMRLQWARILIYIGDMIALVRCLNEMFFFLYHPTDL